MNKCHAVFAEKAACAFVALGSTFEIELFIFLYQRIDYVDLPSGLKFAKYSLVDALALLIISESCRYGFASGGSSSMTEISRSPYTVMARVLGIGVAVITRT